MPLLVVPTCWLCYLSLLFVVVLVCLFAWLVVPPALLLIFLLLLPVLVLVVAFAALNGTQEHSSESSLRLLASTRSN